SGFVHLRIADLAIATDFFDATQGFDVAFVAGAILVAEVFHHTDVPIAELALATMPLRHDAAQPAEVLQQIELPLLRAELEADIAAEDVEFGPVEVVIDDLIAALFVDVIAVLIAS